MKRKYPNIRISELANKRADEIVAALDARGIETSKAKVVSELILSMPIPQPQTVVTKRARKAVSVVTSAAAG